jgi:hypothetical protein
MIGVEHGAASSSLVIDLIELLLLSRAFVREPGLASRGSALPRTSRSPEHGDASTNRPTIVAASCGHTPQLPRLSPKTIAPRHSSETLSPLRPSSRRRISGEDRGGSLHDLVVRHVALVVGDVPAMPERVLKLTVTVAPKHVRQRLTNLSTGRYGLREDRVGVSDIEGQHHRGTADRRRREDPHLRELVGEVQHAVTDAELDRHQPSVGRRNPVDLFGAEGVPVEGGGALGALDDDVRGDDHRATVHAPARLVLDVLAD